MGGEAAVVDAESVCAAFVSASCARHLACDRHDFTQYYGSIERCRVRNQPICLDELGAADSGVTLAGLSACSDAVEAAGCEAGIERPLPACAFDGSRSNDSGCRYDSQCESGFCNRPLRSWCGTCAAQGAAGDECDRNRPNGCEPGLTCASGGSCVAPMGAGASCTSNADCSAGLRCNRETVRVCAPLSRLNETCGELVDCDPSLGLYCNESGLCAPASYASAGDACDFESGLYCSASSTCKAGEAMPAAAGTCDAPAGDGDACSLMNGLGCEGPSLCIESRCEPAAPASSCPG